MTTTTTAEPVRWDRTIYRGTDHSWVVRRVSENGTPYIPEIAHAQIRPYYRGPIWIDCGIQIDPIEGWITITIPQTDTADPEWDTRATGIWDLEVDMNGERLRWVQGGITVSQDVTRDA